MTKTRIIGGQLIETTGGDYNIYTKENIVYSAATTITETGVEKGVSYGDPEKAPLINCDFDLQFKVDKSDSRVVPLGIANYDNEIQNPYFKFNYILSGSSIDSLTFKITDEKGETIYALTYLKEIVITAKNKIKVEKEFISKSKENNLKTFNFNKYFLDFVIEEPDYTKQGSYFIFWDGFDNNEVYNSIRFNEKKLKAKIVATKGSHSKEVEVEFETEYKEVKWVDVKIDRKVKRIDTTLRINLKDGGANGIDCYAKDHDPDPKFRQMSTICPWDKIPTSKTNSNYPIIKQRTKTFQDLEKLALDGLTYHWGRNNNHAVAKNVKINGEAYEVYVNAINTEKNSMDDVSLIYNTNQKWMRSGNPGSATFNPISWIGNLISREAICYNVGYIKYSNGWGYSFPNNEDLEFKDTTAHEIGHEILKSYGGTFYSYGHKGSVNTVIQNRKKSAPEFPIDGEIDLMPYFKDNILGGQDKQPNYFNRRVAAEKDVLSLLWLTKINIK